MAYDAGASIGDLNSWMGGITMPQPTPSTKVTDLSPQVDGGRSSQSRSFSLSSGNCAYDACMLLALIAVALFAFHYSVRAHIL